MPPSGHGEITLLLDRWNNGDATALDELMPLVYEELRRMASARRRHASPAETLQPTAIVHEAYLRLVGNASLRLQDRTHFFAVAARAMRQIIIDDARRKDSLKRGGAALRVTLDEGIQGRPGKDIDIVALDDALEKLGQADPAQAQLVEMRFFAGLTLEEIADVTKVSLATTKRRWRLARAWLFRELSEETGH